MVRIGAALAEVFALLSQVECLLLLLLFLLHSRHYYWLLFIRRLLQVFQRGTCRDWRSARSFTMAMTPFLPSNQSVKALKERYYSDSSRLTSDSGWDIRQCRWWRYPAVQTGVGWVTRRRHRTSADTAAVVSPHHSASATFRSVAFPLYIHTYIYINIFYIQVPTWQTSFDTRAGSEYTTYRSSVTLLPPYFDITTFD